MEQLRGWCGRWTHYNSIIYRWFPPLNRPTFEGISQNYNLQNKIASIKINKYYKLVSLLGSKNCEFSPFNYSAHRPSRLGASWDIDCNRGIHRGVWTVLGRDGKPTVTGMPHSTNDKASKRLVSEASFCKRIMAFPPMGSYFNLS